MKYIYLAFICLTFPIVVYSQSNVCEFGTDADGTCDFYKDPEMKQPVEMSKNALILNKNNRYAYKDYSNKKFNYFLISMHAASDEEVKLFYDLEFQFLDENGDVAFSQFTGGPEIGMETEQELYRNEGMIMRIYYTGEKEGDIKLPKIKEMVK